MKLSDLELIGTVKNLRDVHLQEKDQTVSRGWLRQGGDEYIALYEAHLEALNALNREFNAKAIQVLDARLRELGVEPD